MASTLKEFAPLGANSFLKEWTPFKRLDLPEENTVIYVASPCITNGKQGGWQVSITFFFKAAGDIY